MTVLTLIPMLLQVAADAVPAPAQDTAIVVTASRYPQSVADTLADVQVITAEDIRSSGRDSLTSVLGGQAGINLVQTGGEGASATISLRGTSSGQTLVLVNGVRISSATTGAAAVNDLSLGLVKRIEIVRGPRSVQYGSDAIGGVVNIVTADAAYQRGTSGYVTATAGNHATFGGEASLRYGASAVTGFEAAVGYLRTAGTNFTRPTAFNYNPDLNGYRSSYAEANAHSGPLFISGQFNDFRLHYDPYPGGSDIERARVYSVSGGLHELALGHAFRLNVVVFDAADERRELYTKGTAAGPSDVFNTHRLGISPNIRGSYAAGSLNLTTLLGGDYYQDKVSSNTAYVRRERETHAVFAQQGLDARFLLASVGIRFEHNQQFGSVTTYQVAGGVRLAAPLVGRVSYATSFRAPTFNDLYYPGFSNPNLTPERGRNLEAGLAYETKTLQLSGSVFKNRIRDQIAYDPARFNVFNIQRATIEGFDFRGKLKMRTAEAHAGLEYDRPHDAVLARDLLYRPRWSANAGGSVAVAAGLRVGADLSYAGRRFTDAQNTQSLKGWTLLSGSARYQPSRRLTLGVTAENLLNAHYEPMPGYYGQSRTVRGTAGVAF